MCHLSIVWMSIPIHYSLHYMSQYHCNWLYWRQLQIGLALLWLSQWFPKVYRCHPPQWRLHHSYLDHIDRQMDSQHLSRTFHTLDRAYTRLSSCQTILTMLLDCMTLSMSSLQGILQWLDLSPSHKWSLFHIYNLLNHHQRSYSPLICKAYILICQLMLLGWLDTWHRMGRRNTCYLLRRF